MKEHSSDRHRWQETRTASADLPHEWTPKRKYEFRRFEEPFVGIPTRVFEASLVSDFCKREGKVVAAICRLTYGFMKKKDLISYSQVAEKTGLDLRSVGEVMRNLREASVMTCERNPYGGSILIWGIEEQVELWDIKKLKQLRKQSRARCRGCARKRPVDQNAEPRVKTTLPPRDKIALGTEGQNSPTPEIPSEIFLEKTGAAKGAVPPNQPREEKKGWLGKEESTPSEEQKRYVARLCADLETAGLNPYHWLASMHRDSVPAVLVIRVLEQAVKQKGSIRDFWPWAEKVRDVIEGTLAIEGAERAHEELKRVDMLSARQVLRGVLLGGADGEVSK
jgi:phage replication O-like protein O